MKKVTLMLLSATMLAGMGLASCNGSGENGGGSGGTITFWVGDESTTFYTNLAKQYKEENPDFAYDVKITGADTGSTGGSMTSDNTACADVVTVAHDNIGKMLEKSKILSFDNTDVISMVDADNPTSYHDVIYYKGTNDTESKLYGVPYISQALFLYYNKSKVTDEQVKTFEGLMSAASANNTYAFTITGADGYNYSFNLLARKASDNSTTLKLFEGFKRAGCYVQGDDEVASLSWAHRVFNDKNGGMMPSDSGWASDVQAGKVLSVVGGAWHYNSAVSAFGQSNLGIVKLPTYSLSAADVTGTSISSGTVMQAGTFADCKVFCLNAAMSADKYEPAQKLIGYFASKKNQLQSFIECGNVPAYNGADKDIEGVKDQIESTRYDLAVAQTAMNAYGIPQPFIKGTLNTAYYSTKAPDVYKDAIVSTEWKTTTTTGGTARETLYAMEYIYKKGEQPTEYPAVLPDNNLSVN